MIPPTDTAGDLVYLAEDVVHEILACEADDWPDLTRDTVADFIATTTAAAGWSGGHTPRIVYDVPDDDDRAGWHSSMTGEIHLHPNILNPWVVLHEVAHWLRPRDGHGGEFSAVLIGLVRAGLGEDVAIEFHAALVDVGAYIDEWWLNT